MLAATVPPIADLSDFDLSNLPAAALIIAGLAIGAYGNAGGWRWMSATGIACVFAGALLQFAQAAGQEAEVTRNGAKVVIFIVVVLIGLGLLGSGQRGRSDVLGGISTAIGGILLCLAGIPVVLVVLSANWTGLSLLFIVVIFAFGVLLSLSLLVGEAPDRRSDSSGSLRLFGFVLLTALLGGLALMILGVQGPLG